MTVEQIDEEIARIRRLTPHLRDLADVAARLAALRESVSPSGGGA